MTDVEDGAAIGAARARLVIAASSLGTIFEWYDFFIYGTLAPIIGKLFFPSGNPTLEFLAALASFGVGFGVRPFGAVVFGYLGDKLGRKYTFLATVALMGLATAGVGFVPSYAQIGVMAPVILVGLRVLQGLALGGEYGGATTYVAEHAPRNKRGFYTSFIQASVIGGFLLSLIVVLSAQQTMTSGEWDQWGWRVPFLFSLVLLVISLWMRLKLHESPIFKALKAADRVAENPLKEAFSTKGNIKLILVAMLGIAAGLTVIWYTAQFGALYFLQNSQRLDDTWARVLIGIGAVFSLGWFILFGSLSDRIGRKPSIVLGYALTLILLFPLFHLMASAANPDMADAQRRAPVIVSGPDCRYDPFVAGKQETECAKIVEHLASKGIIYRKLITPGTALIVGNRAVTDRRHQRGAGGGGLVGRQGEAHDQGGGDHRLLGNDARYALGHDLRAGGGVAGGAVPGAYPLQLDVDPLSYRHRLFRRLPAADQPVYRGAYRKPLLRAVVHLRGGGDGTGHHHLLGARDEGQRSRLARHPPLSAPGC